MQSVTYLHGECFSLISSQETLILRWAVFRVRILDGEPDAVADLGVDLAVAQVELNVTFLVYGLVHHRDGVLQPSVGLSLYIYTRECECEYE